jgi:hypothetical protein
MNNATAIVIGAVTIAAGGYLDRLVPLTGHYLFQR